MSLRVAFALAFLFHSAGAAETGNPLTQSNRSSSLEKLALSEEPILTGTWGDLRTHRIFLEQPDSYVAFADDLENWHTGTIWRFDTQDPSEAKQILADSGLEASAIERLNVEKAKVDSDFLEISPPDELILNLTQAQRNALYPKLMPQHKLNPFFQPYALPSRGIRSVLSNTTAVPEEAISLIDQLSYKHQNATRFADVAFVFSRYTDPQMQRQILKLLGRQESLFAKISLTEESNLEEIATYWSAGGRNKEILPILESVFRTSGVELLDIVHLLPATPRKLLFTYPSPRGAGFGEDRPDCFWTAYSFFAETPPDRHLDFVGHVFSERYVPAPAPFQLGDLILLSDRDTDEWIHACNLVAGDLVFTKNGKSAGRPWVLSRLSTLIRDYQSVERLQVSIFRLKPQYMR